MIGQTISHYKILEKLGEGGMGVAYKAHDTKLDRDVALKFLPRDISQSDEERNRFIHEAKAASALDHPNICTIYEVDETPDGQMFIAMGYYEGTALSGKIEKGRLDLTEAVWIAIQIGEGLQAAHEKGIVHRDIKSSNIIVTDKGQVKILDFGLARKKGLSKLTRTGTTVGTASYMSPEQARGDTVDHRTDLWSLGVVLYEMVTGKLPFRGEHEAAILYSVVNVEPEPIQTSVPDASPELIHVIRRALEKDPAERYRTAEDMLIDLRRLKKDTSRSGFVAVSGGKKRLFKKQNNMIFTASLLVVLCVAGYLLFSKKGVGINPDRTQHPLQIPSIDSYVPGISGDGNWVAYGSGSQKGTMGLYIMNVLRGDPRFVTTIFSSWTYVDLSADGSLILYQQYNSQTNKLECYVINSNGGTPRRIIQDGCWTPRFRPDGKRVGYIWGSSSFGSPSPSGKPEFWSVGIDGLDPRREFIDSMGYPGAASFSYSPDGRRVAWVRTFPEKYQEIIIHDLETGRETAITSDKKHLDEPVWIREDKIVYTSDRNGILNVWMVSAQGGEPVSITNGTEPVISVKASISGQKILYTQFRQVADFKIVNIPENHSRQITFTEENQYSPKFSPDGKQIAFIVGGPNDYNHGLASITPSHLYVMDRDGGNRRQLSFGDEVFSKPVWSPDGRRIAYGSKKVSELQDSVRTYIIELSNPNSPKYIAHGFPQWWVDSVRIMVQVKNTVYLTSINGVQPIQVYDDSTRAYFIQGGKYIMYRDLHIGKDQKAMWIVDGTILREEQRKTARLFPWDSRNIMFSDDGKILYSIRGVGEIWRITLPNGKEERLPDDFPGVEYFSDFSPSWDGKEIIIVNNRYISRYVMIENLFK